MDNYAIELLHITKVFPGIVANDDITLRVRYGEIHALLGENGAGKSTLMSVLFGLYQPEEGEILVNGKKAEIKNPRTANALGIGMVHQHFMLVQNFTVLENIVLGVETAKHGVLQMEEARKKVLALSERYGLNIDCDARVSDITVGMQQRVEILKMLYKDNNILIFDEPTAVLTPQEIDELMIIMQNLKREGKAIIFITHKLNEIKAVSDYCTVLRRGKCIGTCDVSTASVEDLSEMMVGRKIDFHLEKAPEHAGDAVLTLENVTLKSERNPNKNILNQVSFSVHKGEILCVAGIEGNGQRARPRDRRPAETEQRQDPAQRRGCQPCPHPLPQCARSGPCAGGPPQVRPDPGQYAGRKSGNAQVFPQGIPEPRLHPLP